MPSPSQNAKNRIALRGGEAGVVLIRGDGAAWRAGRDRGGGSSRARTLQPFFQGPIGASFMFGVGA